MAVTRQHIDKSNTLAFITEDLRTVLVLLPVDASRCFSQNSDYDGNHVSVRWFPTPAKLADCCWGGLNCV